MFVRNCFAGKSLKKMLSTTFVFCVLTDILCAAINVEIDKPCVNDCKTAGKEYVCRRCIPRTLPSGIEAFRVLNNTNKVTANSFRDSSWRLIQSVDISDFVTNHIENNTFSNLRNLRYLGLH